VRRWTLFTRRAKRPSRRGGWGLPTLGTLLIIVGVGLLGCSDNPATNYYFLAFFFDGVPVPPELQDLIEQPVIDEWGNLLDPSDPRAQAIIARRRAVADAKAEEERNPIKSSHEPFEKRRCTRCHSAATSFQAPVTGNTCRQCHTAHFKLEPDDWVHGPVALVKCAMCHLSHTSKYEGLLTEPQQDLCFFCHDAAETLARPYHARVGANRCSTCHDPHSSGNRLLLIDATTYKRRKLPLLPAPARHASWDKKSCTTCHSAEMSNQLLDEAGINKGCLSCHKKTQDAAMAQRQHKPVREGKCTACHVAHRSQRAKLVRLDIEAGCLKCHKLGSLPPDLHPPVHRVDCLLCHSAHSSPHKHLLNDLGRASWESRGGPGATTQESETAP